MDEIEIILGNEMGDRVAAGGERKVVFDFLDAEWNLKRS